MKTCTKWLWVVFGLLSMNGNSYANRDDWTQIQRVSFDFQTFIRVELQGKVIESKDENHLGRPLTFHQSLAYHGTRSRDLNRSFKSTIEIKHWIESELCAEIHELTLHPAREAGVKGNSDLQAQMQATSVTAVGTQLGTKGVPVSLSIYCKSSPQKH
jgi:hypothetical protein